MRASTQEKKLRIIAIATKLFIEQGYKDTSLDQIVAMSGGSKQTLYRYFGNKEGLFSQVLDHNITSNLETVFQLADNQGQSLSQILTYFAIKYLKGLCENPLLGLFRIVSADFNKNPQIAENFWQQGPERIHRYLIDYLQSEQVSQVLLIPDPELACAQLLALIKLDYQSSAMLGYALPEEAQLKNHAAQAVSAFITLYKRA